MMGPEITKIDASWAEKFTKTRVSFLAAPTVRINVAQNSLVVNCTTIFPNFGFQSLSNVSWILILSVYFIFRSNCARTEASEIFI